MTFFRRKFPFLMTCFSHRPYFVCHWPVSTINLILCNIYDPFLAKKPLFHYKTFFHDTFFSQFVLCNASNSTTSRNIGGTDALAVPLLKFWGLSPIFLLRFQCIF